MSSTNSLTAEQFDAIFDEGEEDVLQYADVSTVRSARDEVDAVRKVNCTLPAWIVEEAEQAARHLAVSRSAVINLWLADKAEETRQARLARTSKTA